MSGRALVAALVLAGGLALVAGCGDDGGGGREDAPTVDTAMIDTPMIDTPPEQTFTAFVIDIVLNQTAGGRESVEYATFSDLVDPDTNNPAAYATLFN